MAVEYREIAGWPGYIVGTNGRVWSCRARGRARGARLTRRWRRVGLRLHPSKRRGYPLTYYVATLSDGRGGRACRFVHRLVLEAFVGPCPPGMQCRHLDGNSLNNRLSNLCWGTPKENLDDAVRHRGGVPWSRRPARCP